MSDTLNEVRTFFYPSEGEQLPMRVVIREDEPWFVVADLRNILGPRVDLVIESFADSETSTEIIAVAGGDRERLVIIPEDGLMVLLKVLQLDDLDRIACGTSH